MSSRREPAGSPGASPDGSRSEVGVAARLSRATDSHLVAGLIAVLVGVNVAAQSRINGEFGHRIDDGVYVAVISFATGLICGLVALACSPWARVGLRKVAAALRVGRLRWFQLLGGLGGAMYVASQSVTVSALGVAMFTVCIVAGQTGNSLLVDRLGLAPGGTRHVTAPRLFATVLVIGAVVVGVSDQWALSDFNVLFVVFAVAAGATAAFQQAFNAQVARESESVTVSSVVNFVVGLTALLVLLAVTHLISGEGLPALPSPISGDWWLYLGGPMGFVYTLGLALVVRTLGVLVFGLASIAGQLTGALAIDLVLPSNAVSVGWQIVVAVVITFVAVLIAGISGVRTARAAVVKESAA